MQIDERTSNGITIVTLQGDLDAATAPLVDERLQSLISSGQHRLVVDLSHVRYMSSAGLWVLQGAVRAARGGSGDVRLAGLHGAAKEVLGQTGFTSLFRVFPSVDAALVAFGVDTAQRTIDGVRVVALKGDLDAASAVEVEELVRGTIAAGDGRLVLELGEVPYISSAGLRVLQMGLQESRAKGGDLRLARVPTAVKQVLDLVGFTPIFKAFEDPESAARSFKDEAAQQG